MKFILILFILISNISLGQIIEIDTLNQDIRPDGIERISYDTIVKTYPTADSFSYPNWAYEIKNRIDTNNFSNIDAVCVTILISKSGSLEKIKITCGHYEDCINEAIRVVKSLKKWTPATYEYYSNGIVSTYIDDFTIRFALRMKK